MQETTNLKLKKPELSDVADITVISGNMDIIEEAFSKMMTTDSPQTISGSKTFASAPWFYGSYSSFRSYTKFSDYKQSDTPSDKRMYIHSVLDNANTNIGHVEMGTDNQGTRDYLAISMRGSGSSRNGTLQLRANFQSAGTSLQFFDPVGDGAGSLWMNIYQSHINPSENGNVVAPLSYLNSESKATFLVHRAGTETITGNKIFTGKVIVNGVLEQRMWCGYPKPSLGWLKIASLSSTSNVYIKMEIENTANQYGLITAFGDSTACTITKIISVGLGTTAIAIGVDEDGVLCVYSKVDRERNWCFTITAHDSFRNAITVNYGLDSNKEYRTALPSVSANVSME